MAPASTHHIRKRATGVAEWRYVGVDEAARLCGVSDDTIRRRLAQQKIPGARRVAAANSRWEIPIDALGVPNVVVDASQPIPEGQAPDTDPKDDMDMDTQLSWQRQLDAQAKTIASLENALAATTAALEAIASSIENRDAASGRGDER